MYFISFVNKSTGKREILDEAFISRKSAQHFVDVLNNMRPAACAEIVK